MLTSRKLEGAEFVDLLKDAKNPLSAPLAEWVLSRIDVCVEAAGGDFAAMMDAMAKSAMIAADHGPAGPNQRRTP